MNTSQSPSILSRLADIHDEIRQTYLEYPYPWVIGYSGGKDSTTALQLVWNALREIPEAQRIELKKTKPIYVISTDTLVETPVIVDHTNINTDGEMETAVDKIIATVQELKMLSEYALLGAG